MYKHTKRFVEYCRQELDFEEQVPYEYRSLSVCILDCVYSLRARYFSTTIPVIERYAAQYMGNDMFAPNDGASSLIQHIHAAGGAEQFAANILKNNQKIGGILKSITCLELAESLVQLHIETIEDFRSFNDLVLLENKIHSVKGMGDAGTNYLFMLAGDPDRVKPDVHIHHCVRDACGEDISNDECQALFTEATSELKQEHPDLTVARLDGIIWKKYQIDKNHLNEK